MVTKVQRSKQDNYQPLCRQWNDAKVERVIAQLAYARDMGRKFVESSLSRRSVPIVRKMAADSGIPPGAVSAYRRFYLAYSAQEFEGLLDVCRKASYAISFNCFTVLGTVKDKTLRAKLTREAITGRYSAPRLRRIISEITGKQAAPGGRPPVFLKLSGELLEQAIELEIQKIVRYADMVVAMNQELRPEFQHRLKQVLKLRRKR